MAALVIRGAKEENGVTHSTEGARFIDCYNARMEAGSV